MSTSTRTASNSDEIVSLPPHEDRAVDMSSNLPPRGDVAVDIPGDDSPLDGDKAAANGEDILETGKSRCNRCKNTTKVFCAAFTILVIFVVVGGAFYWYNQINVRPEIRITHMIVSPIFFSPDNSQITANWTVQFEVKNPYSRYSLNYTGGEVAVSYFGYNSLCSAKIWPFFQRPKNSTAFTAEPKAAFYNLDDKRLGDAIRADREAGAISFDVNIKLRYEYGKHSDGGKIKVKKEDFLCGEVEVIYPPNEPWWMGSGRMRGGSKSCPYYDSN